MFIFIDFSDINPIWSRCITFWICWWISFAALLRINASRRWRKAEMHWPSVLFPTFLLSSKRKQRRFKIVHVWDRRTIVSGFKSKSIESKHEVTILGGLNQSVGKFYRPQGTPYEGTVRKVRIDLPDKYPFRSPSIGFMNKIFHPTLMKHQELCVQI